MSSMSLVARVSYHLILKGFAAVNQYTNAPRDIELIIEEFVMGEFNEKINMFNLTERTIESLLDSSQERVHYQITLTNSRNPKIYLQVEVSFNRTNSGVNIEVTDDQTHVIDDI